MVSKKLSNLCPCLLRPGIGTPNACKSNLGY